MPHLLRTDSRSFERAVAEDPLLIVPVGALEAHGPHLPLGADQIQAESTAESLAQRLDAWIAPTIAYGQCGSTREFPGTVSVPIATLEATAYAVLDEFGRMGVRRMLVLSGHAGRSHMAALREAAARVQRERPNVRILVLSDYDFVYELRGRFSPETDGHGGLLETSRVLALAPETVGPARPAAMNTQTAFAVGAPTSVEWPESVQGDTKGASAEIGRAVQTHVLDRLVEVVRANLPAGP